MKKIILFIAALIGVSLAIKGFATNNNSSDIENIRSFYGKYAIAYNIKDYRESNAKCDSIMAIYCSDALCKDTKEDRISGISYDYPTDNVGIDEAAAKTISVAQNNGQYIVTYKLNDINDRFQKIVRDVRLQVTMNNGKIAKVKSIR